MGSLDAGSVSSAGDLADFLRALADKMRAGKSEENPISADFVEAAAAWCDDMPGYFDHLGEPAPQQPSWSFVAQLFAAARAYE